jgi:hypothetical protein
MPTMCTTISRTDYLKLVGLMTLAAGYSAKLRDIERAAAEITGEPDQGSGYYGHTSDTAHDREPDVDYLLERLGITVDDD